jgi:hypothetical protein
MPTPYENLAAYLRRGFPAESAYQGGRGSVYGYAGPSATVNANVPEVGDLWADGLPVVSRDCYPLGAAASGWSELSVRTGISFDGELIATTLEQTFYTLQWRPVALPLEVHPVFRADGTYDLTVEEGTGASAHNGYQDIIGWRAEQDPSLRRQYKYKLLDSNGTPGAEITATANAQVFIQLLIVGVEQYTEYMPVWTKRSIYRGSSAPGASSIGQKGDPSGTGFPSGYEWVKSADNVERIGTSSRWTRDEQWEGAKRVFVDIDQVFVP